jgi:transglutaminase-like putative cysteine protease
MPYDGNGTLGHTVGRYAGALAGGLTSNSDWGFTVGLCAVLWLTGYWAGWLALRERQGVLAVLPLYAVLATNVLNARSPNATVLPVAIAVALSLCVIAATHLEALQTRWNGMRVVSLPGTRGRFAITVIVAAGVLTGVALLVPPATTSDISARLFPGSKPGTGTRAGGAAAAIAFNTGTVPGGALVSHPEQVLTYSTDSADAVYLSVIADTHFVAGNWYPDEGGVHPQPGITFGGLSFNAGTLPRDLSAVDGSAVDEATTVHADLVLQPGATGSTGYAVFTGEPTASDHAGTAFGLSSVARARSLLTVDAVQIDSGSSTVHLRTTALVSSATEDQLRAAGTAYPLFVQQYARLTDDATHGAAAITELAKEWTAGTANPYDAATAIETRLRDPRFFEYTLTPPAPPSGVWPVVYFLQQSHQGYCQYFASAMGAMLRSLGIPTRLMNGYGPGSPINPAGARPGSRQQQVTTSDAHTWVEAFFPGYGWISFEPTPSSAQGVYTPFPRGSAANGGVPTPGAGSTPAPADVKPGFADPGTSGNGGNGAGGGLHPAVAVGIVAGGLLALIAAYALWLFLPRSPRGAWWRLETLGVLRGVRRRASETHRQYAERVGAVHPQVASPVRELAAIIARAEFSPVAADRAADRHALVVWRRIAAATPRLLTARRRRRPA